jgi:ATP-dependent RNA helicase DDX41
MSTESPSKRRRFQRSPSPSYKLDHEDDSYEPYIPIAQRRQAKLAKLSSWGIHSQNDKAKKQREDLEARKEDAETEEENRREMARKERTLLMEAQEVHLKKAAEGRSFRLFTRSTYLLQY